MEKELFHTRVLSNEEIAPEAFLLTFAREFEFIPGQVIGLSHHEAFQPRLYSIASGNQEEVVRILYTVKADGQLTPELANLRPGDSLFYTRVFGRFFSTDKPAMWIATGTGIAPFASMLFSGIRDQKQLVFGNSYANRLYFRKEIEVLIPNDVVFCCSRAHNPACFPGRVTDYLQSLEHIRTDISYYLCGNAEMVVDVRDLLIARGVPFDQIMAEIFF